MKKRYEWRTRLEWITGSGIFWYNSKGTNFWLIKSWSVDCLKWHPTTNKLNTLLPKFTFLQKILTFENILTLVCFNPCSRIFSKTKRRLFSLNIQYYSRLQRIRLSDFFDIALKYNNCIVTYIHLDYLLNQLIRN